MKEISCLSEVIQPPLKFNVIFLGEWPWVECGSTYMPWHFSHFVPTGVNLPHAVVLLIQFLGKYVQKHMHWLLLFQDAAMGNLNILELSFLNAKINSSVVCTRDEHIHTLWHSNFQKFKCMYVCVYKNCTRIFVEVLFIIVKSSKEPKYPSVIVAINLLLYICKME